MFNRRGEPVETIPQPKGEGKIIPPQGGSGTASPPKHRNPKWLGMNLSKTPEFRAFCELLGIEYELPWTSLTIKISIDDCVRVTQEYIATKPKDYADTTTAHNERFETKEPTKGHDKGGW